MEKDGRSNALIAYRHSVVGMFQPGSRFVSHIGLLSTEGESLHEGDQVRVAHMGPPLEADGLLQLDVIGSIALTHDEIKRIDLWVVEALEEERPLYQRYRPDRLYVAKPHVDWVKDKVTGVRRYRRFSCVGFVVEAYREALRVMLVTDAENDLPPIPLPTLELIYPGCERVGIRTRIGLTGAPPYRVMLPGYVLNSLNRGDATVRAESFIPSLGDEECPSLRSGNI